MDSVFLLSAECLCVSLSFYARKTQTAIGFGGICSCLCMDILQLLHKLFPSSRLLTTLTTWPLGGYIMIGIFFLLPIVVGLSINLETCEARWKHTNTFAIEIRNGILIGLMCVLIFAYAIWGW